MFSFINSCSDSLFLKETHICWVFFLFFTHVLAVLINKLHPFYRYYLGFFILAAVLITEYHSHLKFDWTFPSVYHL